ncbi:hypothetical protein BGZ75_007228 [Mortierella antarctica]|nr:hypothetical protein BGZ75_007228 [Mortierella antarctica]
MSTTAPSPQLLQRVAEKKQELEHLLVLRQLANHLETHFDGLSEKFDGLTQGNQVLGNWADVVRTIDLTENYASQELEEDQERSSLVKIPTA